jgi:hypothetical protein
VTHDARLASYAECQRQRASTSGAARRAAQYWARAQAHDALGPATNGLLDSPQDAWTTQCV